MKSPTHSRFGASAVKFRLTRSRRLAAAGSLVLVRYGFLRASPPGSPPGASGGRCGHGRRDRLGGAARSTRTGIRRPRRFCSCTSRIRMVRPLVLHRPRRAFAGATLIVRSVDAPRTSQIGSTLKRSRWESMNALTWAVCVELGRETPKRPQDRVRTPQLDTLPCAAGGSARAPRCSEDPAATRHVPPPAHTLTQPLRPDPRLRGDLRARTPNSIASRTPRSIDSWGCFDRLTARLACEIPGVETAAASERNGSAPNRPVRTRLGCVSPWSAGRDAPSVGDSQE